MKAGALPALRAFLRSPAGAGAGLGSVEEIRGFVFAVAGAPELIRPSEWLPKVFAGHQPKFEDAEQAQSVLSELMEVYNSALIGEREIRGQAPRLRREPLANLDESADASLWSRGFMRGHDWLGDVWDDVPLPDELEEELASILLVLSFFSSRKMAEACHEETGDGKSLEEIARIVRRTFATAMMGYIRLGQSVYRARLECERGRPPPKPKTGRNAPCPCGSGRKFKRCCGAAPNAPV